MKDKQEIDEYASQLLEDIQHYTWMLENDKDATDTIKKIYKMQICLAHDELKELNTKPTQLELPFNAQQ